MPPPIRATRSAPLPVPRNRPRHRPRLRLPGILALAGIPVLAAAPAAGAQNGPLPPPVLDVHLHAFAADQMGPPPLGHCFQPDTLPVWDQTGPWPAAFMAWQAEPPCDDPVWSPETDEELMEETLAVLRRRNVIGVASGTAEMVERWRRHAPDRIVPALVFAPGPDAPSPDSLRRLHEAGRLAVLGEVINQYGGIRPDDPAMEPYFALAEELDIPVHIHLGTGPPGAGQLFPEYRASLHSALTLEEVLVRHPRLRIVVGHAGWPMAEDMMALMWAHPQVHVGIGVIDWALPRAGFERYVRRLVDAGFGNRILFGSDQMVWPGMIERAVRAVEEMDFLTARQKRAILYDNAARFLRFDEETIARHHGG